MPTFGETIDSRASDLRRRLFTPIDGRVPSPSDVMAVLELVTLGAVLMIERAHDTPRAVGVESLELMITRVETALGPLSLGAREETSGGAA